MPPETAVASDRRTEIGLHAVIEAFAANGPAAAFHTALRTRSPLAVRAIAQLAAPGIQADDAATVADAIAAAPDIELDLDYLGVLAGVLYSQERYEQSRTLYSLVDKVRGKVPAEHQNWYTRSALHTRHSVEKLLPRMTELSSADRFGIESGAGPAIRRGGGGA
jgi:hypothetical protein